MNNADQPAMPVPTVRFDEESNEITVMGTTGLTKREHFAGLAMQGLLAYTGEDQFVGDLAFARAAVHYADALLKELGP